MDKDPNRHLSEEDMKRATITKHQEEANTSEVLPPARIKKLKVTSAGENTGKGESLYTAGSNVNLYAHYGKQNGSF